MSDTVHVIAVLTTRAGARAEVLAAFAENLPAVLAENGCLKYVPTVDHDDTTAPYGDDVIVVVEEWQTAADLEAHRVAPHMQAFGARVAEHIVDRAIHIMAAP